MIEIILWKICLCFYRLLDKQQELILEFSNLLLLNEHEKELSILQVLSLDVLHSKHR